MITGAPSKPLIQSFKLSELNAAAYNPRTIDDEALGGLENSISRFNCVELIVVNVRGGRNIIAGGHQRHKVLTKLHGADYEVDCVVVDLDTAEERLLNIALNNPETQGQFDIAGLVESIEEIKRDLPDCSALLDLKIEQLAESLSALSPDQFDDDFSLPDGDKGNFEQMSFTFSASQAEKVKRAIKKSKAAGEFDTDNSNSNGNAMARICEAFLEDENVG